MPAAAEPLSAELKTFRAKRETLLKKHAGEFVLIKGRQVVGFFSSTEKAFVAATKRFGLGPFLIRQVTEEDRVFHLIYSSTAADARSHSL